MESEWLPGGRIPNWSDPVSRFFQSTWRLQLFSWLCERAVPAVLATWPPPCSLSLTVAQLKYRLLYSLLRNQHFFHHITLAAKAAFSFSAIGHHFYSFPPYHSTVLNISNDFCTADFLYRRELQARLARRERRLQWVGDTPGDSGETCDGALGDSVHALSRHCRSV